MNETKNTENIETVAMEKFEISGPWWVILIAGIVTLAFGFIIIFWPLMTASFLVIFFGVLAIVFGIAALIRSFALIKRERTWWILLIEGILSILLGIMVLIWPLPTTVIMIYFIGAWLIVTGITSIASGSSTRDTLSVVYGVLSIILGIFILFRPPFYAGTTLIFFVGFFAIFRGIGMIVNSIAIKIAVHRSAKEVTEK